MTEAAAPIPSETDSADLPKSFEPAELEARWYAEVASPAELSSLLADDRVANLPLLVLGGGSNLLLTRDVDGLVVRYVDTHLRIIAPGRDSHLVEVGAGMNWHDFVDWSLANGYVGLENLALIPGTVGAAPIQNIGAYGTEVAEFIESVEAWDTREHRVVTLDHAACAFGYRDSLFKREPGRYIVTAVRFALPRSHELRLDYAGIREELERMGVAKPAPFHVAEAVVHLRSRKLPDPAVIGNAGSFFKNPIVDAATGEALKREHPELVAWPGKDGRWKLSAAWLIEAAGLKGHREGDAGISHRHALVLVNHGHASGPELWALAQQVIARVREAFGVTLEPEPVVIGG